VVVAAAAASTLLRGPESRAVEQLTTQLQQQQADVTNETLTADSFTLNNMKSGGLLWMATVIMMIWLATLAEAYYLSDKEVSVFTMRFSFFLYSIA